MNTFTRSFLPLPFLLIIVLVLAACGGAGDDGEAEGDPDAGTAERDRDAGQPGSDTTSGFRPGSDTGSPGYTDTGTSTGVDTGGTTTDTGTPWTPPDGGTTDTGGTSGGDDAGTIRPGGGEAAPGSSCNCDADCASVDGHAGICVYGVCMTRASADCSSGGSTAECATGSRCWFLGEQPGPICWPDCDSYSCAGACDGDDSCAPTESTDCDASCGSYCSGGSSSGGGTTGDMTIGSICGSDADCGDAYCMPDGDDGWIDGYCFGWDCGTANSACGESGVCVSDLTSDGTNVCMQNCDAGCRDGYQCVTYSGSTFCYPYCETTADCPEGYQCGPDTACIPGEPCSASAPDGYCAPGQACDAGTCVDECSASATDGWCPAGFHCETGVCMSDSGCGTWQCTGSNCYDLVQMPGSGDPSSVEARTAGYYIYTEPHYSYLRRDLALLLEWAACEMRVRFPGITPIAVSDMTQADGLTPGSDVGSLRHPSSTHRGEDVDLAYFQTDGANNYQIICGDGSDRNSNGVPATYNDGYFCTTETNIVDVEQQVWFFSLMAQHPDWRVVGVDETLEDDFIDEIERLYSGGLINSTIRERLYSLGTGADGGWQFHHHHTHFSFYSH